jgi:hypothetical protein
MKDQKMFRLNLKNEIFLNMGFIYSEKKDLKSAENIYKEMIAYSPKSGTLLRISIHLAGSKASFK